MKKFFGSLAFLSGFLVLFYLSTCILQFKYDDGVLPLENYYDLPEDTVDVLLLGSSHMGMNVDSSILWDEYGIASYACWGGMQPTWNTYYYLKECIKNQSPKLVVMDTYVATGDMEYADYSSMVKNTQAIRWSLDKLNAIDVTATEAYKTDIMLGWPTFHSRYSDLSLQDFNYFFWNKHTQIQSIPSSQGIVYPTTIMDVSQVTESKELFPKQEEYLRKIIELCEQNDLPIQLVAAPYTIPENEQKRFNRIGEIAQEYGIGFTNYNACYQEIGIDPQTDFRDEGHLNDSGIEKYSKGLGKDLKKDFDLPDRREDPNHIWNQDTMAGLEPVYRMEEQFIGDGVQKYVDTGLQLYQNPLASWTILAEVDPKAVGEDKVFFSCFSEDPSDYRGVIFRGKGNGALQVKYTSNHECEIKEFGDTLKIAIVKNNMTQSVYVDGKLAQEITLDRIAPYEGNLLIGCEDTAEFEKFRFSKTTVRQLEVYDTALEPAAVAAWDPQLPPLPKEEEKAPQPESEGLSYVMAERFLGDGVEKYLDTGVKLYQDPEASWTVLARISPEIPAGDTVYVSCFSETIEDYRGLLLRRVEPGKLNIVYGQNASVTVDIPQTEPSAVAVVKTKNAYSVYVNGEQVVENGVSACNPYDGSLLIGCQTDQDGAIFRYSGTQLYNVEVKNRALTEEEILGWNPAPAPEPQPEPTTPVSYTMKDAFLGDGAENYVDTGVKLYDQPEKSWTLDLVTVRVDGAENQVVASCFSEDPNSYRGLVVRQKDSYTYALSLGQQYLEFTVSPERNVRITVVKDKFTYAVYCNGELIRDGIDSRCPAYDGNFLIGCQEKPDGQKFRFGSVKVSALSLYDEAWTAAQVKARG